MNRAARRAARRTSPIGVPLPDVPLFPVTSCVCDGYPCPFCSQTTAPDEDGIWRCLCGWSGVLVVR